MQWSGSRAGLCFPQAPTGYDGQCYPGWEYFASSGCSFASSSCTVLCRKNACHGDREEGMQRGKKKAFNTWTVSHIFLLSFTFSPTFSLFSRSPQVQSQPLLISPAGVGKSHGNNAHWIAVLVGLKDRLIPPFKLKVIKPRWESKASYFLQDDGERAQKIEGSTYCIGLLDSAGKKT